MTFVITMTALVHHADLSGVSQPRRVSMMLDCSTGELLARAAFMHHDDQRPDTLNVLCRPQIDKEMLAWLVKP